MSGTAFGKGVVNPPRHAQHHTEDGFLAVVALPKTADPLSPDPSYRQARSTEETLLRLLPPDTSRRGGQATQASPSRQMQDAPHSDKDKRAKSISTPAPPLLLSRSHTCIELLPPPFPPQSRANVNDDSASGSIGSDGRKLNRASDSTSSRANPTRYEETKQNPTPRVAKVRFLVRVRITY